MPESKLTSAVQIERLLSIGIALSSEKDHFRLLEMIVSEARQVTNCDAGTLFLSGDNQLHFKIVQNETLGIFLGGNREEIALPPVQLTRTSVSAIAALDRKVINIPNVYDNQEYDLTGPQKYDALTGYHTQSMLVVPLENHQGEIIGVLQLINARDEQNVVVPFAHDLERVVASLASQAAVSLTNMQYLADIDLLFQSFVQVLSTAIDARTPYNANHSGNIASLVEKFAAYLDSIDTGPFRECHFSKSHIAQLTMAAWLHDIGKLAIPLTVMDKETRLGNQLPLVLSRLDVILLQTKLRHYEEGVSVTTEIQKIAKAREIILKANNPATFVDDSLIADLQQIAGLHYQDGNGQEIAWLSEDELVALSVRKGTLTEVERKIMESHVAITERMLEKISFNTQYKDVPKWAVEHHEFLDGSGYLKGLKDRELSLESRMLTMLDIFDALTAADRPYKKAMPKERAFQILQSMVSEGKLDEDLVNAFQDSQVWDVERG